MDARILIFAVVVLTVWSFVPLPRNMAAASIFPTLEVVTITDTVRVEVPADSITAYILAEMRKVEIAMQTPTSVRPVDNPFQIALFELYRREGYVPTAYRCPAGLETIGFGDVIDTDAERRFRTTGMPFSVARAKVYANLKTGADEIGRRFPGKYRDPHQWLALTLLGHSVGWARLEDKYPAFYGEIRQGQPSARWLKYCRYRDGKTGAVKKSSNLARTRNVEWLLFNREFAALTTYHADASRVARTRYERGRAASLQSLGLE